MMREFRTITGWRGTGNARTAGVVREPGGGRVTKIGRALASSGREGEASPPQYPMVDTSTIGERRWKRVDRTCGTDGGGGYTVANHQYCSERRRIAYGIGREAHKDKDNELLHAVTEGLV